MARIPKPLRLLSKKHKVRKMPDCEACGNGKRLEPWEGCSACGLPPLCCEPGGCPSHRKGKRRG